MGLLDLREPVSAGSHGLWMLLAIPGTILLWRRARGDLAKQVSLLAFGVGLVACYAASAAFHGVRATPGRLSVFDRVDHAGIFVLIAGSYTPIAWNLLGGAWRWGTLASVWATTALGTTWLLAMGALPVLVATAVYLVMGWGGLFCCVEIARVLSGRSVRLLVLGGVVYSVGAALNVVGWPVLWPGVFGAHELFHLFVMAGSLAHFAFMLAVVAPFAGTATPKPRLAPSPARTRAALGAGLAAPSLGRVH
jgi:hemolysin III